MGPDLQVAVNTSHQLLVTSPEMFFWKGSYLAIGLEFVLCFAVARLMPGARAASFRLLLYFLPLSSVLLLLIGLGWTNTMDIHWDTGTVTTTDRFLLGFSRTYALATGDIRNAAVVYERTGPVLTLNLRNGGTLNPLGTVGMYKPSQVLVAESINDGLKGMTPQTPTGDPNAGAPSGMIDLGSGAMLQHRRELEERLKREKQAEGQR